MARRSSELFAGGTVWLLVLASAAASCSEDGQRRRRDDGDSGEAGADPSGTAGNPGNGGTASGGTGSGATGADPTGAGATGGLGGSGATSATGATGSGATGATSSAGGDGEAGEDSGSGGTSNAGTSNGGTGTCSGDECVTSCGDGRREGAEECDDGNSAEDDGCSSDCAVEDGFTCTSAECTPGGSCVLRLPAVFRDFNGYSVTGGHPDFQPGFNSQGAIQGLVQSTLDADGKPVSTGATAQEDGNITSIESFAQWYRDDAPSSGPIPGEIVLWDDGNAGFVNRWGANGEPWLGYDITTYMYCANGCADCGTPPAGYVCLDSCLPLGTTGFACIIEETRHDGNPLFFPIDSSPGVLSETRGEGKIPEAYDGLGWPWESYAATERGISSPIPTATAPFPSATHNFSFTTEVRFRFRYDASMTQTLSFLGDDDVWVFVNGHLAIDLGGWHIPLDATLTFAGGSVSSSTNTTGTSSVPNVVTRDDPASVYELEDGNVYEIAVFHAERQKEGSSFKLGLTNFDAARSACGRN